jgi:hypothetical protein
MAVTARLGEVYIANGNGEWRSQGFGMDELGEEREETELIRRPGYL